MDKRTLAKHLDFANHHADATIADIKTLCKSVLKYGFNSAFVNAHYVRLAKSLVKNRAKVGTVVSFPLGQDTLTAKVSAAADAAKNGADELDVSMNVGLFKDDKAATLNEMKSVVNAARKVNRHIIVKFIIETGFLNKKEIESASILVVKSGADFVKTCSGMGPRGAKLSDVYTIKKVIPKTMRIKVAGGISTTEQALAFLKAGAHRMGTSKAIEIVTGKLPKEAKFGSE